MTDNGCGIAREDLPHIFERFYRGRPIQEKSEFDGEECPSPNETSGIGLGLYLVKNLTEQIQAEIVATSPAVEGNRGTRLTIFLPVCPL